ncbi:MAG: hypothetical protein DRJ51_01015 [Thermoprotei archaeon]|nr:MAG: hypothetical protein DRJ51_01015 [Thermoprotei archaeon]RLF01118.1 MAG: hypothetical protein DRJ59_06670 [Thermoprotei archaeon]
MRGKPQLAILVLLVITLSYTLTLPLHQFEVPSKPYGKAECYYYIRVLENGSALVNIEFRGYGKGSAYIYLPRFTKYTLYVVQGEVVTKVVPDPIFYFYHKRVFNYTSPDRNCSIVIIKYPFSYASLMIEDKAWFMTPLIRFSENVLTHVEIIIPNLNTILGVRPQFYEKVGDVLRFRLDYRAANYAENRIAIDYTLKKSVQPVKIVKYIGNDSAKLVFYAPRIYMEIVDKITQTFDKAYPHLKYIFGFFPQKLEFQFYLPSLLYISKLGYVEREILSLGKIHVNLVLLRFKPGYLEHTAIHEFVHVALGKLGVNATRNTRWIHEGLAEYIAIYVEKRIGINVSDMVQDLLKGAELFLQYHKLGELVLWPYGPQEGLYYAASYYVMKELGDRYGGIEFFRRVFAYINETGGINETKDFIDALARVGGNRIYNLFASWGFPVSRSITINLLISLLILVTWMIALIITLSFLLARKVKKEEGTKCPYCGVIVDPISTFCPFCGRELTAIREGERVGEIPDGRKETEE